MEIEKRILIGGGGGVLVVFGMFSPLLTVPIIGAVTGINKFGGLAWFPFFLVAVVAIGLWQYRFEIARVAAVSLLISVVSAMIKISYDLNNITADLSNKLANNMLHDLAVAGMSNAGLSWGAPLLLIGAVLLLTSCFIYD